MKKRAARPAGGRPFALAPSPGQNSVCSRTEPTFTGPRSAL